MGYVLERKPTKKDSLPVILEAIYKLASDKHHRALIDDEIEWLNIKLKAIKSIAKIALNKTGEKNEQLSSQQLQQ